MNPCEWEALAIGDAVRIREEGARDRTGRVADKIHEYEGIYTVLVEIGCGSKKPFLKYFDLSKIRRISP